MLQASPSPFYEERVLCYQCYTGLDAMRFFAKKGDYQAYQWTRQRILQSVQPQAHWRTCHHASS